jgi:hypothetical protein
MPRVSVGRLTQCCHRSAVMVRCSGPLRGPCYLWHSMFTYTGNYFGAAFLSCCILKVCSLCVAYLYSEIVVVYVESCTPILHSVLT